MSAFNFGEVYKFPVPYTDFSRSKTRPVVILSSDKYNESKDDVIIISITSKQSQKEKSFVMPIEDYQSAGVTKNSVIKPIINSALKSLLVEKIGELSKNDKKKLKKMMKQVIC